MTMYDRIRQLRTEQGMSQEDLARKVGYKGRSMIARVESGQVDISQTKIQAFAQALNTSVDYLLDGEQSLAEEFKRWKNIQPLSVITKEDTMIIESVNNRPVLKMLLKSVENLEDNDILQLTQLANRFVELYRRQS